MLQWCVAQCARPPAAPANFVLCTHYLKLPCTSQLGSWWDLTAAGSRLRLCAPARHCRCSQPSCLQRLGLLALVHAPCSLVVAAIALVDIPGRPPLLPLACRLLLRPGSLLLGFGFFLLLDLRILFLRCHAPISRSVSSHDLLPRSCGLIFLYMLLYLCPVRTRMFPLGGKTAPVQPLHSVVSPSIPAPQLLLASAVSRFARGPGSGASLLFGSRWSACRLLSGPAHRRSPPLGWAWLLRACLAPNVWDACSCAPLAGFSILLGTRLILPISF